MAIKPSQYKILQPFQAWVQQTLPAIYDDSLSYTDLLAKLLYYVNMLAENNTTLSTDMKNAIEYINNYFDNLDVQDEINNKLDRMVEDGTLMKLIAPFLNTFITPEMYGAVGDGVHDDTTALQECLDACGYLYLNPSHTYLITKSIKLKNYDIVFGEGTLQTNDDIILLYGERVYRVLIKNATLIKKAGENYHIVLKGDRNTCKKLNISSTNYSFSNYTGGIYFASPATGENFVNTVRECLINKGQIVVTGTDNYIVDNVVWASTIEISPPVYAIKALNNSQHIHGNQIVGGSLGEIYIKCAPGPALIDICENYFDGSYDSVNSGVGLFVENALNTMIISNNKFYTNYKNPITLNNCNGFSITGNVFINGNRGKTDVTSDIILKGFNGIMRGIVSDNNFENYVEHSDYGIIDAQENSMLTIKNNNASNVVGYTHSFNPNLWPKSIVRDNIYSTAHVEVYSGTIRNISQNRYGFVIENPPVQNATPSILGSVTVDGSESTKTFNVASLYGSYIVYAVGASELENKQLTCTVRFIVS